LEWPKVKNIIILILLLVNAFLLLLVGGQQYHVRLYQRSALTQAAQVLEQNGIQVSQQVLDQADGTLPAALSADRDTDAEAALARALLGEDVSCSSQSGVYTYTSSAGSAVFRAGGSFSAELTGGESSGGDNAGHAIAFLQALDLECEFLFLDGDGCTVTVRQLLDGVPLYSCQLELEYEDDRLFSLSGTVMAAATAAADSDSSLDLPTALIRFMAAVRDSGDVCSSVTGLRPGYRSAQSFGSVVQLTPVWLVSTNVSDYYLDGITGELTRT
jgi:hypothetical protein